MEAVLTALADPAADPAGFDEQLELALRLAGGCDECWQTLDETDFPEPHTSDDPIVRAVLRAACPTWGLYLWSRHLRLVRQLEPGVGFAFLVAEEAIDLARRRREASDVDVEGCPRSDYLDAARRLAEKMALDAARRQPAHEVLTRLEAARAACVTAETARRVARSAHRYWDPFEGRVSPEVEIDLALADLHVEHAEHPEGGRWVGSDEYRRACELLDRHDPNNPVRFFEIMYEGWISSRGRSWHDGDTRRHLLRALDAVERHPDVLYRLNGLFQKARLVAGMGLGAERGGGELLVADVVADLVKARGLVETYGDTQSQGLYHQYLGDLLASDDPLEALKAYGRALEVFGEARWFRQRVEHRLYHLPDARFTGWYRRAAALGVADKPRRRLPATRSVIRRVDQGLTTVSEALEEWAEHMAPGAPRELSAELYLAITRLREVAVKLARSLHRQGMTVSWDNIRPAAGREVEYVNEPGKDRGA